MATQGTSDPDGQYSVRQVSGMLDLSPRQIRALVADGALTPTIGARGKFLFSFQDLVVLRSVAELIRSGVALHKVRAAVTSLLDQLPDDALLTGASLDASGKSVVVSVDTTTWDPVTRQMVLDLDVEATTERIAAVVEVSPSAAHERTATEWYVFADEIESSDPLAAEDAYRRSIQIDDTFADAHLNLGRLLHAAGKVREALDEYRVARMIDGEDAVTHYNIGVASQDLGDFADAVEAYDRAIELAPRFADARYNLSTLYEELDDTALAVQHLHAYRNLIEGDRCDNRGRCP